MSEKLSPDFGGVDIVIEHRFAQTVSINDTYCWAELDSLGQQTNTHYFFKKLKFCQLGKLWYHGFIWK